MPPRRPAILLVGRGAPERGGIPTYLDELLQGPLAGRYRLSLLNLARPATRGGVLATSNVVRTVQDARRLWREAAGVDVVHVHSAAAPAVTLLRLGILCTVARLRGCRVIAHVHGGRVPVWLTSRPRGWFAAVTLRAAHCVIAVSAGARDALAPHVRSERLVLVNNGVDVTRFAAAPPPAAVGAAPRVLFVGGLTRRKGVLDLVEASTLLAGGGVAHELVLVGGVPDEGAGEGDQVVAAIRAAAAHVHLAGPTPREDMASVYAAADVVCLPSWWEAQPLTVLEAMATGRPVVATDVGDVPKMVHDGRSGLLVPPRAPTALAAALDRLLRDPVLRAEMGAAGRADVGRDWSLDAMLDRVSAIYDQLCAAA